MLGLGVIRARLRGFLALSIGLIALVVLGVNAYQHAVFIDSPDDLLIFPDFAPGGRIDAREGIVRWRNIAYAEPPVGPLRWRPPVPVTNNVMAQRSSLPFHTEPLCLQTETSQDAPSDSPAVIGSEDCLYLDIVRPWPVQTPDEPLPVMVWIHGGGNVSGHKNLYDFKKLATGQQVLVVTLNYRLGPLGFFLHPGLHEVGTESSNVGLLDIIAALQWLKVNIAHYGGRSDHITVFGESAGGHNIYALLASPRAQGLFQNAIVQSGYTTTVSVDQAINRGGVYPYVTRASDAVIRGLKLDPTMVSPEQLRAVPGDRLIETYNQLPDGHHNALMVADGVVLPKEGILAGLANPANRKDVRVVAGYNKHEVTLWLGVNRYFINANRWLFNVLPPKIRIKNPNVYRAWVDIRSAAWGYRGVVAPLAALEDAGYSALYAYRFDWNGQAANYFVDFAAVFGASHGAEIAFLLGDPWYGPIGDYMYPKTESSRLTTQNMMASWGAIARGEGELHYADTPWPRFHAQAPEALLIGQTQALQADSGSLSKEAPSAALLQLPVTLEHAVAPVVGALGFSTVERCLVLWDSFVNIGVPDYEGYQSAFEGVCRDSDALAARRAIEASLIREYGSVDIF